MRIFRNTATPAMNISLVLLIGVLCLAFALPGCASRGGRTYTDREVRTAQRAQKGVVADVTEVMVEDDPSLLGTTLGGVTGGVLGSMLGGGRGRTLFALGGAAAGALAGTAAESQLRKYQALQITVDLDNGDSLVVVQTPDEDFRRGDRVRVITGAGGSARVQHL